MKYGKKQTKKKLKKSKSKSSKYVSKLFLTFFKTIFIVFILCICLGIGAGIGIVKGIIDNAPDIDVESILPMGYATSVYDAAGNITDTLVMEGSNRQEATYDELPQDLINAFVAIEDARFWKHKGVDTKSILRAVVGVIKGDSSSGGGSTITQQLIKNNVFNGGREKSFAAKLERKIQEQYLAIKLEQTMDKKIILTNYLNTINLGNNSLGVKVAAKRYFNKDVSELTLSESTVIAGITQNPSRLNPISGRAANEEKRKVILQYMFEQGYITKAEQEEALADNVYDRIQNIDIVKKESKHIYSYFTDELISQVSEALVEELGYSETQAHNLIYSGGLSIYTTQDPQLQKIVDEEVNNPDNYTTVKYSVEYRLSIKQADGETKHYSEDSLLSYHKNVLNDNSNGIYETEESAKADVESYKASLLKDGDEVIGETFKTILEPQVSFVLMEQSSGEVKAINGGRGQKTSSLTLNRATDTVRQPGSTFKILTAFAPALDAKGNTLATVYYDAPYTVGNKSISNWYNSGYLGYSSIRDSIIYSMNIVAVKTLMDTVSPELGVEYAKNFGITSLTDSDYTASLALGGLTKGVSNLELTAAFASIANQGIYTKPIFFTKIVDHNGKTLIDNTPKTHRVLKESTAFLLTDAMADSMEPNRKFARSGISVSSTGTRAKLNNMSAAGKSGTTSKNNDIWFVGYTPYYTAGIWGGYDNNQKLTGENGGTRFHKDIWKKIMDRVHEGKENIGFSVPDSVEKVDVCRKSGKLPISGLCNADPRGSTIYSEYFAKGTAPTTACDVHTSITVCAESGGLPTPYCPSTTSKVIMIVPNSESYTDDSIFANVPVCSIHSASGSTEHNESGTTDNVGTNAPKPSDTSSNVSIGVSPGSKNNNDSIVSPAPSGDSLVEPLN